MHPFDNESIPDGSSWFSHVQDSHGCWPSQNYFQVEARLKERIVNGKVDFRPCFWDRHADGEPLNHLQSCFLALAKSHSAKRLVTDLLTHDHLKRATVYSALESRWIKSELKELQDLYQQRIEEVPGL